MQSNGIPPIQQFNYRIGIRNLISVNDIDVGREVFQEWDGWLFLCSDIALITFHILITAKLQTFMTMPAISFNVSYQRTFTLVFLQNNNNNNSHHCNCI